MNRIAALVFRMMVLGAGRIRQLVLRILEGIDLYFCQATAAEVGLMRILELRSSAGKPPDSG